MQSKLTYKLQFNQPTQVPTKQLTTAPPKASLTMAPITQPPIILEIKKFSETTTLVYSNYSIVNPISGVATPKSLEACYIPIGYNKWNMTRASIHMHHSPIKAPNEKEKSLKICHRFYFEKPNGEKQKFHEQKMFFYANQIYEEILFTIDESFYQENKQDLVSADDTLKIVIEPEVLEN